MLSECPSNSDILKRVRLEKPGLHFLSVWQEGSVIWNWLTVHKWPLNCWMNGWKDQGVSDIQWHTVWGISNEKFAKPRWKRDPKQVKWEAGHTNGSYRSTFDLHKQELWHWAPRIMNTNIQNSDPSPPRSTVTSNQPDQQVRKLGVKKICRRSQR